MALLRPAGLHVRTLAIFAFVLGVASSPAAAQEGIPCPAEPTNMAIAYGDVVTCAIQPFGDTDTFTFSGVAGDVVVITATYVCFTLTAPSSSSVDACGNPVAQNRIDAVLSETGTFTVTTRLQPVSIINYTLALERVIPAARARAINYGGSLTDTINVTGDTDLFSFEATANDTVTITASATGMPGPCLELIAPNNSRSTACANLSSNQIQVTLLQAGAYVFLIRQGSSIAFTSAWTYSVQVSCTAGPCSTPPDPPSGLQGTVSAFTTTLTWSAPTTGRPPSSYVIEAGTTSGGTSVMAFDTLSTSTTFIAPGVPNGTYFVRIKSKNSVGTSGPSNEITITGSTGCLLPSAPGSFTASATGLLASFQWAAASGNPTSYVLEAGSSPGSANIASVDLGLTTQFATPAPAGTYFVRVRARNGCGLGPASNEVTLVVGCSAPPGAPPTFTASVSNRVVTLNWTAAAGQPSSYVVEVGSATALSNLANFDVGNLLTMSAGAPPGTYFVRVRARNTCGTSGPSIERIVVVP